MGTVAAVPVDGAALMRAWPDTPQGDDVVTLRRKLAQAHDRIKQLEDRHERDQRSLRDAWTFARSVFPARPWLRK